MQRELQKNEERADEEWLTRERRERERENELESDSQIWKRMEN